MINKLRKVLENKQFRCVQNYEITYEDVKKKLNNGALLIDVRSLQEYNEGHLYNAIHLADYDLPAKYKTVLPNKNAIIILYCQNGGRSKRACKRLKKLGYTNVYNLHGGLDNIF